ncbi:concanavalin A-like lectin protein kinase family protein [Actinidia rufa]|uniref:Concanavalin A-like lectin protein kinase family protein n=1 Tax=Actinidia rufa TaxID=165716 RepID=A0A7J0D8V5_9ERIC|nr:concanavalin A-like lectin protein kinase family protein [Actinidia rufa]
MGLIEQRAGKATYRDPLHLWDKASGDLADFSTHFAFVIDSYGSLDYADGLTFFLAPTRANITVGGAMGLPVDPRRSNRPVLLSPWSLIPIGIGIQTRSTSIMVLIVESGLRLLVDLRDCGLPEWVEFEPGSDPVTPTPKKRKAKNTGLVVGLIVGSCALVGGLALLGFGLWNRSRGKEEDKEFEIDMSMENEFETGSGPKKFTYGQLSRATNNFSEEQKLGEGGFGGVYRGFLRDLNFLCCCQEDIEGVQTGNKGVCIRVHGKRQLRFPSLQRKSHADVGDEVQNCARLGLGIALSTRRMGTMRGSLTTRKGHKQRFWQGLWAYLAPECVVTGKASKETDVYSFGVVALEIACGRKPFDLKVQESQMRMVEWVWDLYGTGKLLEAADPKLSTDFDEKEMECLMVVGLWCAHPDHTLRPSIRQAIQVLNFEAPLPILPAKLPALTFFCPPVNSPTSLISLVPGTTISNTSSSYYYNTDSSKLTSSSAASSPSASFLHTK